MPCPYLPPRAPGDEGSGALDAILEKMSMESMKLSLKLKNQQTVEPALDLNWQHLFCSCPLLSWLLNWEQHDTGGHLSLCKVPNVKCLRVPALGRALPGGKK